jgi:hypothetical protein
MRCGSGKEEKQGEHRWVSLQVMDALRERRVRQGKEERHRTCPNVPTTPQSGSVSHAWDMEASNGSNKMVLRPPTHNHGSVAGQDTYVGLAAGRRSFDFWEHAGRGGGRHADTTNNLMVDELGRGDGG